MTQSEMILKYIDDFGSITTFEAFTELGITRLASRVSDLRKAGYNITGEFESKKNRYGEMVSYKRYRIGD